MIARIFILTLLVFSDVVVFGQQSTVRLDTCRVFTDLAAAIASPEPVYRLDLSKQRIKTFPEGVFLLRELREINLDRNKLDSIPQRIHDLKHLEVFSAERNRLDAFPVGLCGMRSLRVIRLGDNEITRIPDCISGTVELEELIMWSNQVGYYPAALADLPRLKTCDFLHVEMSKEEQARLIELLPEVELILSPPCDCTFLDPWDEEEGE